MCTCASCSYTDSFAGKGFDAWPRGNPAGPRGSARDYAAHEAHVWVGVRRKPQAVGDFYGVPAGMTRAEVQAVLRRSFEPVREPTLLDLARQLRKQARAERRALKLAA